jgi:hypothetical protein
VIRDLGRDHARHEVAARGLTPDAVTHLTRDALGTIDFAALAPAKKLLKRYFSDEPWDSADDDALAELVGPGEGWWRYTLDDEFALAFGWRDESFRLDVVSQPALDDTFAGAVVPEATPNPRTIRFVTPPIHDGVSKWYESAEAADDPRVARLFAAFPDVANVLVGPTFVAVGLTRADRWEHLLDPVLRAVSDAFATPASTPVSTRSEDLAPGVDSTARSDTASERGNALERAWKELGSLRPDDADQLDRIVTAAASADSADRQVSARLLVDAPADLAGREWQRLLGDSSRRVRRATVDAMVDAQREGLRPLLESALGDADAWTRWKALRGLVDLGIEPSRNALAPLAADPDFRVRLEAAAAQRSLRAR